ncbi:MAG TPA: hypothetical protein PLB89_15575 [Flavobacteriales bacterium]|nr:hypothetical protein [Flavobacteriales bacterium]
MRPTLILLACWAMPVALRAQCQIGSFTLSATCFQQGPLANIVLSGGTPPYQLQFTGMNGASWSTQSFQNGPFSTVLPTTPTVLEPPVELQVTDAQGCVAFSSAFYFIHVAMWPEVWFENACGGNAVELYWNGLFTIAGAPGNTSPCGYNTYMITGLQGFEVTGSLAADWSQPAPGVWRFNTPLPFGTTYAVRIWNSGAPNGCYGAGDVFHCTDPGTITVPESPTNCGIYFRMQAALTGALPSGTLMTDGLRAANLIPLTEPYTALGYQYVGMPLNPAIPPTTLAVTGNNAIVDWVVVELRAQNAPGTVVYSKAAVIQRDGDVVEANGTSNWLFAAVPAGVYHVAIRHRNHLGIMTEQPYFIHNDQSYLGRPLFNFRHTLLPMFGVDARKNVGTVYGLWPGDANFDGVVKYTGQNNDRDAVLQAVGGITPTNSVTGYLGADINLDGIVRYTGANNDRDIILQTIGGVVPTATRLQQLP